jgi:hypothetical protein
MATIIDCIPGTWSEDGPKYMPVSVSWFSNVVMMLGTEISGGGTGEGICYKAVFPQLLSWNREQTDNIDVLLMIIYLSERFKGQDIGFDGPASDRN